MKSALENLPTSEVKQQLLRSAQQIVREQFDEFNNTRGISCFSEVNDNLLMWSHYGGQHKGFCLEFRTNIEPLTKHRPVTYATEVPEFDIARLMVNEDYEHTLDLFCTKSADWAYEREWRVIHGNVGTVFNYASEALKAIYFGAKMTPQDIDLLCLILHAQNPGVELYRGYRSPTRYKIDFKHVTYTSFAEAKRAGLA